MNMQIKCKVEKYLFSVFCVGFRWLEGEWEGRLAGGGKYEAAGRAWFEFTSLLIKFFHIIIVLLQFDR